MNEDKFTGKAAGYDKYRPSYPKELIDYLYESTRAENVADIGAGTGIFTKCLAAEPWKITAVEPNPDMLAILTTISGITAVKAPAESTGLPAGTFGLITAAQAFHWFDAMRFKAECRRIMTENAKLAIVWNGRESCEVTEKRDEICKRLCDGYRSGHAGAMSDAEGDLFLKNEYFSACCVSEYFSEIEYDLDSFIGDNLSRSYAPKKSDEIYGGFIAELTEAFNKLSENGKVKIPYKTTCYLGTF